VNFEDKSNAYVLSSIARAASIIALGCLIGVGVFFLAGKELRWLMLPAFAIAGGIFILVVPEKRKVLTALFVLSFQVDIFSPERFEGLPGADRCDNRSQHF
jgi:cell division protein FtsW (lipid II flippase)